jgi:hypothetical protein
MEKRTKTKSKAKARKAKATKSSKAEYSNVVSAAEAAGRTMGRAVRTLRATVSAVGATLTSPEAKSRAIA